MKAKENFLIIGMFFKYPWDYIYTNDAGILQ